MNDIPKDVASSSEYRYWAERVVARACALETQESPSTTLQQANRTLVKYRAWAGFWQQNAARNVSETRLSKEDTPRRQVWSAYYKFLSTVLASDLEYTTSPHSPLALGGQSQPGSEGAKTRQRAELLQVEKTYETLILQETRFPKATQTNEETEVWIDQVIANWRILCGPRWTDADLGEGGKQAVGRGVLDVSALSLFKPSETLTLVDSLSSSYQDVPLYTHLTLFVLGTCFACSVRPGYQSF